MKLILTIFAMILFLITGCESGKQPANDFLTVDITANYPKKEPSTPGCSYADWHNG